jgi:hypothetical protein
VEKIAALQAHEQRWARANRFVPHARWQRDNQSRLIWISAGIPYFSFSAGDRPEIFSRIVTAIREAVSGVTRIAVWAVLTCAIVPVSCAVTNAFGSGLCPPFRDVAVCTI